MKKEIESGILFQALSVEDLQDKKVYIKNNQNKDNPFLPKHKALYFSLFYLLRTIHCGLRLVELISQFISAV